MKEPHNNSYECDRTECELMIDSDLMVSFVDAVLDKYPSKAYGFFLSSKKEGAPDDFIMFKNDIRNEWKDSFEEYGNYYKQNEDAGFLATEEEIYRVNKEINKKGKYIVGVFHSHKRHPAIFSKVDVDLHPSENLWHLIISLRNIKIPQVKVFKYKKNKGIKELKIRSV